MTDFLSESHRSAIAAAFAILLAGLCAGCGSAPPPNYYTLSHLAPVTSPPQKPQMPSVAIAVGPVTMPDYLDRRQIVTRESPFSLSLAANDLWAAPLSDQVPRVLVADVAARRPNDRVVGFPQIGSESFDYRVAVDIGQFDVDADGTATLTARWQIYDHAAARAVMVAEGTLREERTDAGYAGSAAALSQTLADLSQRIAEDLASVRSLAPTPIAGL
ncbi:MAG: membrane integrity-associated transporter subunit PqiC [Rhodospirillales bacterium]|nr:membrane integrity-associated transporter subunit PqiC [Rhodospirillales bacterium]